MSPWYSGVERQHQQAFKKLVQRGDAVIDIGANWGVHTLLLSQLVGKDGSVIALEPYPLAFHELTWHLQTNNCLNVKTLPLAISDIDGEALFAVSESPSQGALSVASGNQPNRNTLVVQTRTLDSLTAGLGLTHVKLVKIDVEGAESKVLEGADRVMQTFKPYFLIDLHTPEQDLQVAKILVGHSYKLERIKGPPITRTDVGWPNPEGVWGNILASHPAQLNPSGPAFNK